MAPNVHDCEMNIFVFWNAGWTKWFMWKHHVAAELLWFKVFSLFVFMIWEMVEKNVWPEQSSSSLFIIIIIIYFCF